MSVITVDQQAPMSLGRLRRSLVALGGADYALLMKEPTDVSAFVGRGFAAFIPAIFGCAAVTISFEYAFGAAPVVAAAAGLVWAGIVLAFDLSLLSYSHLEKGVKGFAKSAVKFAIRAAVSVLAALTFAGPIVLFMYSGDIATQMAKNAVTDATAFFKTVDVPAHAAALTAAQHTLDTDQGLIDAANATVAADTQKVQAARLALRCETKGASSVVGCPPGTGHIGYGPAAAVRQIELTNAKETLARDMTALAKLHKNLGPAITAAQSALTQARNDQQTAYKAAQVRYAHNTGLIQRWRALGQLESASPGVATTVRLLELLIIGIDLSAVIAKLTINTPAYDLLMGSELEKTRSRTGIAAAEANAAFQQREAAIVTELASTAKAAAGATAEVARLNDQYALEAEQRSGAFAAEEAQITTEAAITAAEAEAEVAEIKSNAAFAAAEAEVRVAEVRAQATIAAAEAEAKVAQLRNDQRRIELELARMELELARMEIELGQIEAAQTAQPNIQQP